MTLEEVIEFAGSGKEAIHTETKDKYYFTMSHLINPKTDSPVVAININSNEILDLDNIHQKEELVSKLRLA